MMLLRPLFTYRRLAMLFATFYCLGMSGCKQQTEQPTAVAVSVQTEHPVAGSISEEIDADAILAPLAQAALDPKISAPVRRFYVQRGSHVHKGELLAVLEDQDLQGNALDSEGNLNSAEAEYATATQATIPEEVQKAQLDMDQAKANMEVADLTASERKRLLQQGAIAGREVDTAVAADVQARAAYDIAAKHFEAVGKVTRDSGLQSAQGQLTSARGRYRSAEAQVNYAQLRSPIDGVVTDRPLFAGETAAAGSPVITVMDTSSLLAKLHLAQASAQELHVGGTAEVQVPGMENRVSAVVTLISPALDPGSTTVEVWLKLENRDGALKVGTPVRAVITGRTAPDALLIPTTALLPGQDGSTTVMVDDSDSVARTRTVVVGIRTPEKVQILKGLSPADRVIVDGSYGLDNGTKVTQGGDAQRGEGKD